MSGAAQIEYVNTLADLTALSRFTFMGTRGGRLVTHGGAAVCAGLITITSLLTEDYALTLPYIGAFLITAVIAAAAWYAGLLLTSGPLVRLYYRFAKNRGVLGRHSLTLTDDGLREDTEAGMTLVRYHALEHISENAKYVFIFVTALSAHIVPRAAMDEFVDELRRRIAEAGS